MIGFKANTDKGYSVFEHHFCPLSHDLHIGMVVPGLVTNITNFGCFVNIGVKQDGLIHISELANKFIKDPNEAVKLQQAIKVKIIEVDITRNRINLSKKQAE